MRIIHFLPVAFLFGIVACNNASETTTPPPADTTRATASHDSMNMGHMDSVTAANALPAVPAGAKIYFKNLKDGQTVTSPVKVEMGIDGIRLDTAGVLVAGSGHHHLLIDAGDSIPMGLAVPKDEHHMHFGKAQSSAEVKLAPGKHVLTLQYADGIHRSYGSRLATTITVTVK